VIDVRPVPARLVPPRAADLDRELTAAALGGAGWAELLGRVRDVTGRHCRLVGTDGAVLAATDGGAGLHPDQARAAGAGGPLIARDGWPARAVAAASGTRTAGLLLLAEPAGPDRIELLRAAVTAVLIEAVRREAAGVARFADGSAVIAALRAGPDAAAASDAALADAAARFGIRLDRPGCGAVLGYSGTRRRAWASALGWMDRPVQRVGVRGYVVVTDGAELARLRERLELAVGAGSVRAACGAAVRDAAGYGDSFAEAERLLAVARLAGTAEIGFDAAGLLQVLLATPEPRLRWFVDRHLGPLLRRPELLVTLRAWLASSGSRRAVSEQLHLHRNSVGYRVGQLKALLGVDPLRPEHAAVLHTALAAHDLLRGGDNPAFPAEPAEIRPQNRPSATGR